MSNQLQTSRYRTYLRNNCDLRSSLGRYFKGKCYILEGFKKEKKVYLTKPIALPDIWSHQLLVHQADDPRASRLLLFTSALLLPPRRLSTHPLSP